MWRWRRREWIYDPQTPAYSISEQCLELHSPILQLPAHSRLASRSVDVRLPCLVIQRSIVVVISNGVGVPHDSAVGSDGFLCPLAADMVMRRRAGIRHVRMAGKQTILLSLFVSPRK